jgi:hypothetical protein
MPPKRMLGALMLTLGCSWIGTHGKRYFNAAGEDQASVEGLLLETLKVVADSELRQLIEEALIAAQR